MPNPTPATGDPNDPQYWNQSQTPGWGDVTGTGVATGTGVVPGSGTQTPTWGDVTGYGGGFGNSPQAAMQLAANANPFALVSPNAANAYAGATAPSTTDTAYTDPNAGRNAATEAMTP